MKTSEDIRITVIQTIPTLPDEELKELAGRLRELEVIVEQEREDRKTKKANSQ
jgi:hypothetical protein